MRGFALLLFIVLSFSFQISEGAADHSYGEKVLVQETSFGGPFLAEIRGGPYGPSRNYIIVAFHRKFTIVRIIPEINIAVIIPKEFQKEVVAQITNEGNPFIATEIGLFPNGDTAVFSAESDLNYRVTPMQSARLLPQEMRSVVYEKAYPDGAYVEAEILGKFENGEVALYFLNTTTTRRLQLHEGLRKTCRERLKAKKRDQRLIYSRKFFSRFLD